MTVFCCNLTCVESQIVPLIILPVKSFCYFHVCAKPHGNILLGMKMYIWKVKGHLYNMYLKKYKANATCNFL